MQSPAEIAGWWLALPSVRSCQCIMRPRVYDETGAAHIERLRIRVLASHALPMDVQSCAARVRLVSQPSV